ncbi:MAG: ATP-dependent sacrificial sulfur transferase LarE [Bacteroidetes bacterium]|nr:ATP-dependent sacrificial sulfur transferase LarE [Bacteroidota bacterium]
MKTAPNAAIEAADVDELRARLERQIASYGSVVIGFSAGVDSSVVAAAAAAALGANVLAVTAVTETITREDQELATGIACGLGIAHELIAYNELDIPNYSLNPANRCYYCKDALYARLAAIATERGISAVLDGSNADDAGDYRPGRTAAAERAVRSPLLELGITKAQVRSLATVYGLPNHDKPSAPCLSSRVPYGTQITREILERIAAAERALRDLGFRELRVRHHDDVGRIEVPRDEFSRAVEMADAIDAAMRHAGYRYAALDLRGFRSGSLNEVLTQIELPAV